MPVFESEYLPVLAVRPAEMAALQELPEKDKDLILPVILLRPWVGSHTLSKTVERVAEAIDERPWIADIDFDYSPNESAARRDVHDELDKLKSSKNGYENWCKFFEDKPNVIPCLQISEFEALPEQIERLNNLSRGIAVRLQRGAFPGGARVAEIVAENSDQDLLFILDYGHLDEALMGALRTSAVAESILDKNSEAKIAPSGSSFPSDFRNLPQYEILERQYFNALRKTLPEGNMIYSDRGSARAEVLAGGGKPVPRIDYPVGDEWHFFRNESGYRRAAQELIKTSGDVWIDGLRIWGTQMIERTERGDEHAIGSASKATAVRINLHLHQQLWYGKPRTQLLDTDDDWTD